MTQTACPYTLQKDDDDAVAQRLTALPDRVAAMREKILEAVESGDIEKLRPAIERNEVMPLFGSPGKRARTFATAIDFLKAQSFDGEGREILLLLGAVLNAPYAVQPRKPIAIYVWPAHAINEKLARKVPRTDLYRFTAFADMKKLDRRGLPLIHRVEIGADGTWHFFAVE